MYERIYRSSLEGGHVPLCFPRQRKNYANVFSALPNRFHSTLAETGERPPRLEAGRGGRTGPDATQ